MGEFYPLITYILVVVFTPGPNNIMSMVNGMRVGYSRMLRYLLGITCGFFILALGSGILNMALASLVPSSSKWLKILSAAYMLYLAYRVIRSGPIDDSSAKSAINTFWFGFSMQYLNVKGILFGITVFSLFINDVSSAPLMILLFAAILGLLAFIANSCWALGGTLFRSLAQKHYRIVNIIMGGLLIYSAIAGLV